MKRMNILRSYWTTTKCIAALALVAIGSGPAMAAFNYYDWSRQFVNPSWVFSNTSAAGTITSSNNTGATPAIGTWGVPDAITLPDFTNELEFTGAMGGSITFNFSNNYGWGTGGNLIFGNIHNYYEYTLSAWDFSSVPINVNAWTLVAEYPPSNPTGISGYGSTSPTNRTANGNSSVFFVQDSTASANFGQGGVMLLSGLTNVGKVQLTLTNNNLAPNGMGSDFILFNFGTQVPEPACAGLLAIGVWGIFGCSWRSRGQSRVEELARPKSSRRAGK
jgi:hypothetical protein